MSVRSDPTPWRSPAPAGSIIDGWVVWALAAIALGALVGLTAGVAGPQVAVVVVVLPLLVWLFLRPDWLPAVLMVTVFSEAVSFGGLTISRAAAPLAIAVVLLRFVLVRREIHFPRKGILVAVGAYAVWAFASMLWTVSPAWSFGSGTTSFALSSLALSLAYFFAIAILVDTEALLRRAIVVLWAMSVVMGAYAILQFLSGADRSVGASGDANFFAALEVLALPVGVVVATHVARGRQRAFVLASLAIVIGSIMTSLSRGGLLALIGIVLLIALQPARTFFRTRGQKTAFVTVVLVGAVGLLAVSYDALSQRTSSLFATGDVSSYSSGRAFLWDAAEIAFQEHRVFGLGAGAFPSQSNDLLRRTPGVDFSVYRLRESGQFVHNSYLESFAELGIVGGVLFIALMVAAFMTLRALVREARAHGDLFLAALSRALQLALLGFALTSVFLSAQTHRTLWVLLGLALAVSRVVADKGRDAGTANQVRSGASRP